MQFIPLHPKLTLGFRGEGAASFGDEPFYMRPFIYLRGAPAMRYQGEEMAQIEAELRWQFWKRLSLVGFVGGGAAEGALEIAPPRHAFLYFSKTATASAPAEPSAQALRT
jgi:hypothetical protein